MINKNMKKGFTLVELMVLFMFLSLVLAASTPIITKRVKNAPERVFHGKFVCTYDNGYKHYYYNSNKMVSSGEGCSFTPPKTAVVYKVELIGAGAGGYNYIENPWTDSSSRTNTFNTATGTWSNSSRSMYDEPDGAQLQYMLEGIPYHFSVSTGYAGDGGDISISFTGTSSPRITYNGTCYEDGQMAVDGMLSCSEVNQLIAEAKQKMKDDYLLGSCSGWLSNQHITAGVTSNSYLWCYNIADEAMVTKLKTYLPSPQEDYTISSFSTETSKVSYGGSGGGGNYLVLDGNINFIDPYTKSRVSADDTKSYLINLLGGSSYITTGSTSTAGSCASWSDSGPVSYTAADGADVTYNSNYPSITSAEDGEDQTRYAAMMTTGGGILTCITADSVPTGGMGGSLTFTGASKVLGVQAGASIRKGTSPEGVTGSYSSYLGITSVEMSDTSRPLGKPYVYVDTTISTRYHSVGTSGGAGDYTIAYVPFLQNDCTFSISGGGSAVDDSLTETDIATLEETLGTSLSCNGGTLSLSASGGTYSREVYTQSYPGTDYFGSNGEFNNLPEFYYTVVTGDDGPYASDVYTRANLSGLSPSSWGAGGNGNSITDYCTTPYGENTLSSYYYTSTTTTSLYRTETYDIPYDNCDPLDEQKGNIKREDAASGGAGAVIISW